MKKFHIEITDNETGEALFDFDTDVIIGGCNTEDCAKVLALSHAYSEDVVTTCLAAKSAVYAASMHLDPQIKKKIARFDGSAKKPKKAEKLPE